MTSKTRSISGEKVQLALLGLIVEKERYGYELKQEIQRRNLTQYVPFTLSGFYNYLRSFQRKGWITLQLVEKNGKYPERNVYKVTEKGRERFRELMKRVGWDLSSFYDSLHVALAFSYLVSLSEFQQILITRKQMVDRRLQELEAFAKSPKAARLDLVRKAIVEHAIERFKADSTWLEQFIEKVSKLTPKEYESLIERYKRG